MIATAAPRTGPCQNQYICIPAPEIVPYEWTTKVTVPTTVPDTMRAVPKTRSPCIGLRIRLDVD